MKWNLSRRQFMRMTGAAAGGLAAGSLLPRGARAARDKELNIFCWEGYNSDVVLDPFRKEFDANVKAETQTSDPEAVNRVRAGESRVFDLINLNNPWARKVLWPEKLIKELDRGRFEPYFNKMMPSFKPPYRWAMSDDGQHLLGMCQRFGPFSFVVNTDKISRDLAEDQGFDLFNDDKHAGKYGILTFDDWNVYHMCIGAGVHPFRAHTEEEIQAFEKVARKWVKNAKVLGGDPVQMNLALINGEIDFYCTGGTYTASPARFDGKTNIRGITPKRGPMDGKGGIVWIEVTSVINNPEGSPLAYDFLEYVQRPEVAKVVAFAEGTYNTVAQMGNPDVLSKFTKEELDAVQWDSLEWELERSYEYDINPDYPRMIEILNAAKRER